MSRSGGEGRPGTGRENGFVERWCATARRTPDRPALWRVARVVSFAQLDEASAAVATALRVRGLGRGHRVAVSLEHDVPLMETILGILRAGAAFVPVDRRHPDERIGWVVAAARADLTVIEGGPDGLACPVVDPVTLRRQGEAAAPAQLSMPAAGDPAYVLFTSGSTGEPKGVVVPHGALARYLDWAVARYLRFGIGGAPLYSSIGFDLTVTTLLAPLAAGRPVHLVPAQDGVFGVADLLADGVSLDFVKLTPSHLRMLLAGLEDLPLAGRVGCLVLGGEALPADLVRDWRALSPQTVVVNEYGPTEATVGCCVKEVAAGEPVPDEITIGTAIPSVGLHVLNAQGHAATDGEIGELYIGGDTLADGYLDRPGLTGQRFVADPYASGRRLYRTGDLVRRRSDGELSYLGRNDDQIKIRGHRVEPGEIAVLLRAHPDVRDCVVRAWRRDAEDVRLVAHVVPGTDRPVDELRTTLVAYLLDRLPDYLVPRHIVPIAEVPRTLNGKIDGARLPDPVGAR